MLFFIKFNNLTYLILYMLIIDYKYVEPNSTIKVIERREFGYSQKDGK